MKEFYRLVSTWLIPLGYTEIYTSLFDRDKQEVHFIKEGIKVICVLQKGFDMTFKLHSDGIGSNKRFNITTQPFLISTKQHTLEKLFLEMKSNIEYISSK